MDFDRVQLNIKQEPPIEFGCEDVDVLPTECPIDDDDSVYSSSDSELSQLAQDKQHVLDALEAATAWLRPSSKSSAIWRQQIPPTNDHIVQSLSPAEAPSHCQDSVDICVQPGKSNKSGNKSMVVEEHYPFECFICGMVFKKMPNLKIHLQNHPDIGPKQISPSALHNFINDGSTSKPYSCKQCYHQYSSFFSFRRHMRSHLHPAKFKCSDCGSMFHRSDHFKNHQMTHICPDTQQQPQTRLRDLHHNPMKCVYCGIISTTQKHHNRHKRLHMEYGVDKPLLSDHTLVLKTPKPMLLYTCTYCGQQFLRKYNWRCHTDTHTHEMPMGFKCDTCEKRFHRAAQLKEHQRSHDRLFKCEICGNSIRHKSTLARHMEIHIRGARSTKS